MIEAKKIKRLPYGNADFDSFTVKNLYFVDKTQYIRNIEEKGDFLFFIRPRRFGKTLFLSVLGDYYDIAQKDQFDTLFEGTDIQKNPTTEKNKYLVFKLNFSLIEPQISKVEDSFVHYIQKAAKEFVIKYEKFLDIDIKEAEAEFNAQKSASDVMVSFLSYCSGKKEKLFIIIDEYDNFANTILSADGEAEFQRFTHAGGFLRAFFNVLKGGTTEGSAPISRLFMTGVSPITLDDVTSGFNIATNISLEPDLNCMLGFTKEEVIRMVNYYRDAGKIHHSTDEIMEIMARWYNHYRFSIESDNEVFNTVLVLYFLQQYMFRSKIPLDLIDRNMRIDYGKLRHLIVIDKKGVPKTNGNFSKLQKIIEDQTIKTTIKTGFSISELHHPSNFVSLLYYFGLLTIRGSDEEGNTLLSIPNETVKHLYYDFIKATYEETGGLALNTDEYLERMQEMAFRGNWEALVNYIAKDMESSLGLRDLITGEKAIQVFWNVYLGLSKYYIIHTEKEMNQGYADILMEPLLDQYPNIKFSYLLEIKYMKPLAKKKEIQKEKLDKLKEDAGAQLDQYGNDERFLKVIGQTALKKIILIFSGHRLIYHGEASFTSKK